jgi:hypothetical protein
VGCERVLQRFGIVNYSYVDADCLQHNTVHARKHALLALHRKIGTAKFQRKLFGNDEAIRLCAHAFGLDVENNETAFQTFVVEMTEVANLLKLKIKLE